MNGGAKFIWILEGLFVVFAWSASKIMIKMGLETMPPYLLAAAIQLVALIGITIYWLLHRHHQPLRLNRSEIYLMVLNGLVAFAGAKIFSIIGLQYVTGSTAGLIATTSVIFSALLAYVALRERPSLWQYVGLIMILAGSYVFLERNLLSGTVFGVLILLIAEAAFAFNNVVTRLLSKRPEDVSITVNLVGNLVGAMVLVPIGMVNSNWTTAQWSWQMIAVVVAAGLIFGFGGLMWSRVLDRLRVVEVAVLLNTMMIQVALLSTLFLSEILTMRNIGGGLLVLAGAFVADRQLIAPARKVRTK
ncbi:MAG: DMT family transporter [bacterium]